MEPSNKPLYVRLEPEVRERIKRQAADPQFGGVESTFARYSLGVVMDLRDALGPRFEMEVARLLETANEREGVAA